MSQNPTSPIPDPDVNASASPADNAPHRPTDDREEVYYEGSPMLRGDLHLVFGYGVVGVLLIAGPIYVSRHHHLSGWLIAACVILGLFLLAVPLIKVKAVRYRITNYRIDYERGWLSRTIDTLEMWHVEHIKFHQSLWARILGVGNIQVIAHDPSEPSLYLRSIPHARELFTTLEQRIIAVKRARGVIKMDTGG